VKQISHNYHCNIC